MIVRLTFSEGVDVDPNMSQVSLNFAAEAATSFQWNRLSDHVGRKPVLLSCLVGTTLSILLFGLSHSFWALVLRCFSMPTLGGDVR
jgi:MFS family permease